MKKDENFNIKNKKLQSIKIQQNDEIFYIINKNKVQQDVKNAKIKLQKWKNNKKKYEILNTIVELLFLLILMYYVLGWTITEKSTYFIGFFALIVPLVVLNIFMEKFKKIFSLIQANDYRLLLDDVSLFGDLRARDFTYAGIVSKCDIYEDITFKYIYKNGDNECEKNIENFLLIRTSDVKKPVLVFERMEYYVPEDYNIENIKENKK